MKDNTRTAIGYICIALVVIGWLLMMAWIMSPQEFTFKIEMDNNTKEAIESINYTEISNKQPLCYSEKCYFDIKENQIGGCGMTKVDCREFETKFALDMEDAE